MYRKFMEVPKEFKENDFEPKLPKRSTKYSAGYDFYLGKKIEIPANGKYEYVTDICASMVCDEVLKIYIRSSLAIKKNITLTNNVGIVDHDYFGNFENFGNIIISLKNHNPFPVILDKDTKVTQGIFEKYFITDDDISEEERIGGMGSTGD